MEAFQAKNCFDGHFDIFLFEKPTAPFDNQSCKIFPMWLCKFTFTLSITLLHSLTGDFHPEP